MVEKVIKIFNREIGGLHQAAFLLGVFAVASQLLALVRDRLFAHYFGASTTLDVYYAAFRIPDLVYAGIASLVSVTVIIPFIVARGKDGDVEVRRFLSGIFTSFLVLIMAVSAVLFALAPVIVPALFPGFGGAAQSDLIVLVRILLVSPILLGISNLFGSVTQTYKQFFVYALSPILYNLGIIIGVVFFYPHYGIAGLGYGVVLGAVLHAAIQIPILIHRKVMPRFSFRSIDMKEVWGVVRLSLPRTLGLSANHLALLVLVSMASAMAEGSVSVFNLSFNLQSVPLSIIGVSYSVAAFPTLARLFSKKQLQRFTNSIITAARHILFWSIPILMLFIVLRAQIVRTVLGSGAFGWSDTMLTAASLALFSVSLLAQALVLLFARGFYAAGNTRMPLIVNTLSSFSVIVFAYGFTRLFDTVNTFRYFVESLLRVDGLSGTSVLMLPLAYSLGVCLNAVVLYVALKRRFCKGMDTPLELAFRHSFYAGVVMGFVAYQFLQVFARVLSLNTFWGIFMQGFFSGILGIAAGVILLKVLKNRELGEISRALHTKFWKARPVAPEQEEL